MYSKSYPVSLGPNSFDILLNHPDQSILLTTKQDRLYDLAHTARLNTYTQIMLNFIPYTSLDECRSMLLHVGALFGGAAIVGCFALANQDAPLELYVPLRNVYDVFAFLSTIGYTFRPSLPTKLRPKETSDVLEAEVRYSNTRRANKNPFTPTMDNDAYIANVFVFRNNLDREIHVVAANVTAIELVFAMQSTLYMNFISATDLVMLYPHTTLDKRAAIDCTSEVDAEFVNRLPSFGNRGITFNPRLRPTDVTKQGEISLLPRWVGDEYCLVFPLQEMSFVSGEFHEGARNRLFGNSWQLHFTKHGYPSILTTTYRNIRIKGEYSLAPVIRNELHRSFSQSWIAQDQPSRSVTDNDEATFLFGLQDIYAYVLENDSHYRRALSFLHDHFHQCLATYHLFPPGMLPVVTTASIAYDALNVMPGVLDVDFFPCLTFDSLLQFEGTVWSTLVIIVEGDISRQESPIFEDKPGLADIAMTIRILTLNFAITP
ncbi:hypothetical protein VNI00_017896 [Paramarasmius palmivorus]|uniref:Uncharacterized protein n=1 Tax=Paramarasmius palmivorus TaxID=297713 RepID=A0AAW0B277_9AGAR